MPATENQIGIIILAAGESKRLGEPKQLLNFEGKTLIRRAIETATGSKCFPVAVVLGAHFENIEREIEDLNCLIFRNENWRDGISSSIKTGIERMRKIAPEIAGVIITLCDQPFVKMENLNRLIEEFYKSEKPIIASKYGANVGVPALFSKEYFSRLLNLSGDLGAKKLIGENIKNAAIISFSEAAVDIDTPGDYEKLLTFSGD